MSNTRYVNLTAPTLVLRSDEENNALEILDSDIVLPSEGRVILEAEQEKQLETVDGIPNAEQVFASVPDLPESDGETLYIVAAPVAFVLAAKGRNTDIRYTDSVGPTAVRGANRSIFAVRRLLKARIDF